MGDVGDYWREHKEYKRKERSRWHECPHCAVAFGGNGTLTPPGQKCRNCDWVAPSAEGNGLTGINYVPKPKKKYKCASCGRRFRTPEGRSQHEHDVHST